MAGPAILKNWNAHIVTTKPLREKLMREITHLERQLEQLRLDDDGKGIDFSMLQTYKELIQCRRGMLKELPIDNL